MKRALASLVAALRMLWAEHKPTMILMAAACAAALFFAMQFVFDHRDWRGRPPDRPEIEAWMTVRFVAHAYHLRPDEIRQAIGFDERNRKLSLQEIAARQGRETELLLRDLNQFLASQAPPGGASGSKK